MASEGTTKAAVAHAMKKGVDKPAPDRQLLAFASILGFFPIAILAILSSLKTGKLNKAGDYEEAHVQSKQTRDWIIISFVNGVFVYFGVLSVLFIFAF